MSMVFPLSFAQIAFSGFQSSEVFCLNFCLGRPFGFSTQQSFSFLFFSFLFQTLYFQSLSMLIQQSISSPSKYIILVAPPDMIFLVINGPDHLGFIFPLRSKVSSLSTFRTKSHSLSFLGFTFLLNALAILFWYPCAWYYALAFFSSTKANCSYLAFLQSSFKTLVSTSTLKDCISTSIGSIASLPQTKE